MNDVPTTSADNRTDKGKRIILICRTAVYGNSLARESLETALAAGALGAQVSMLFLDEGVWQLVERQKSNAIGAKNHGSMLNALPLYDVDNLLVDRDSLEQRGIEPANLSELAQPIEAHRVKEILADHDIILSF